MNREYREKEKRRLFSKFLRSYGGEGKLSVEQVLKEVRSHHNFEVSDETEKMIAATMWLSRNLGLGGCAGKRENRLRVVKN